MGFSYVPSAHVELESQMGKGKSIISNDVPKFPVFMDVVGKLTILFIVYYICMFHTVAPANHTVTCPDSPPVVAALQRKIQCPQLAKSTDRAQALPPCRSGIAPVIFLLDRKPISGRRSWGGFVFNHSLIF